MLWAKKETASGLAYTKGEIWKMPCRGHSCGVIELSPEHLRLRDLCKFLRCEVFRCELGHQRPA
eukprot:1289682-Amphidinium_carterae.1